MINKTKQNWTVGQTVKIGFMSLVVKAAAGTQLYKFVPHNGVEKIGVDEARELMASAERHAARIAAQIIARVSASREIDALFA